MSSPFARTYKSVEEVIQLYPHLPRESIMLTHTLPPIEGVVAPIEKNRKRIKRRKLNITPGMLPSIT